MSWLFRKAENLRDHRQNGAETNFMGGISYRLNPIDTLRMVTASGIFGEPKYYRSGAETQDGVFKLDKLFREYAVIGDHFTGKKTSEVMQQVIQEALDYDFEATIRWALTLRTEYMMRLNPQVIMVMAAMHKDRPAFNAAHPGLFSGINCGVMSRADEPASQLACYLYLNGSKRNLPNVLKRGWASRLESLNAYQVHKYRNTGLGMIDVVRICHACSPLLDELMKTGDVRITESETTWETMRSGGASWQTICESGVLGHMALLRNLRGIFSEVEDSALCKKLLEDLKAGVKGGRQYPFRYYSALQAVRGQPGVCHLPLLMDALEECMDIACENMPVLRGRTMCLSDNSGSAWGSCTSEYGTVTVAVIDNLSGVITARNSEEGYVGKFGDSLRIFPISKRNGVLAQTELITKEKYDDVGGNTENGMWIFFRDAIDRKEHWDNIFIYSDMQAGHGGLYGTDEGKAEYAARGFGCHGTYIDVAKLIAEYRRKVNPKVNVFCVQTAGYHNVLVPEYGYRTNILYGWTGKELLFADAMIRLWDERDGRTQ